MIKLILTENSSSGVLLDTDTLKVNSLEFTNDRIDRIYTAPRDLEVIFNDKSYLAKKGDLVVTLYSIGSGKKELIILKSEEYLEYIDRYKKYIEESNMRSESCSGEVSCGR